MKESREPGLEKRYPIIQNPADDLGMERSVSGKGELGGN